MKHIVLCQRHVEKRTVQSNNGKSPLGLFVALCLDVRTLAFGQPLGFPY